MKSVQLVPEDCAVEQPRILFVDDERSVLNSLKRFARARKWRADIALGAEEALIMAGQNDYDIVISDMRMPKMNGADFLLEMKNRHPDVARILLTGYSDMESLEKAINESHIFNYVTKPWNDFVLKEIVDNAYKFVLNSREKLRLQELTQKQNKKLSKLALMLNDQLKDSKAETQQVVDLLDCQVKELKESAFDSLSIVTQIIEWKEGRDSGHSEFVVEYAIKVGRALKRDEFEIEELKMAAILHRIGVLGLPDDLRVRPTYSFNAEERALYEQYPVWGEMALSSSRGLQEVGRIIRHHQEYVNGTGSPGNKTADAIPLSSKIICLVADFFDVYNGRKIEQLEGFSDALEYICEWKGKRYESSLVDVFVELLKDFSEPAPSKVKVKLAEIEPGDILATDVVTRNGLLLLKRGALITDENLNQLKKHVDSLEKDFEIRIEPVENPVEEDES